MSTSKDKITVSIITNSDEYLPVTLMSIDSKNVSGIKIIDNGGRSVLHNKAVLKLLDYYSCTGRPVTVVRTRAAKFSLLELRKLQVTDTFGSVLFLDDDVICSPKFIDAAVMHLKVKADVVAHSVASLDDAEGFGVSFPIADSAIRVNKWTELQLPTVDYEGKLAFWSACTAVNGIVADLIQHIDGKDIDEGEEVHIEKYLQRLNCSFAKMSGYRVFHMGNEWSKVDLIHKMDSIRR